MSMKIGLETFTPFITSEIQSQPPAPRQEGKIRPLVTISRQSGCGAHAIGEKLAVYLEKHAAEPSRPWKLFDENLVRNVLAEHRLPRRLARFMSEDRASEFSDMIDEMLGTHPPFDLLVKHTKDTITGLAQRGNVILIGWGANVITRRFPHATHVRLVASLEKRVEHVRLIRDVPKKVALELVQIEDRGRNRYLKKYFGEEPENPLLYHLVLNTDLVPFEVSARMIGDTVLRMQAGHDRGQSPARSHSRMTKSETKSKQRTGHELTVFKSLGAEPGERAYLQTP